MHLEKGHVLVSESVMDVAPPSSKPQGNKKIDYPSLVYSTTDKD